MRALWNICGGGIYIKMRSPADGPFFNTVSRLLNVIRTHDVGRRLLELIAAESARLGPVGGCTGVCIMDAQAAGIQGSVTAVYDLNSSYRTIAPGMRRIVRANGSPCLLYFDHSRDYSAEVGVRTPYFLVLAHELIHCYLALSGKVPGVYDPQDQSANAPWKHEEAIDLFGNSKMTAW
jgi:hypothetical protein